MGRSGGLVATVLVALAVIAGTCLTAASEEPSDLEGELARLQAELAAVTAERDALLEAAQTRAERHEKSSAAQQMIVDIIADPAAFGTDEEVLDLLDDLAAPGAVMDDVALGAAAWRDAWRGTLFGAQADIHTWTKWMAPDGSIGGSLWTWAGRASNGEPFALPGIDVSTYDDEGRTTSVTVYWPYEDAEVKRILYSGNDACAADDV